MLFFLFLTIFPITSVLGACPAKHVVSPCDCVNLLKVEQIICNVHLNTKINLTATFNKISANTKGSGRHFSRLIIHLHNGSVTEIPSQLTGQLTFDRIRIGGANLKKVHSDAFKGTANKVRTLWIDNATSLESGPTPYNIFDMINKFSNVELLMIDAPKVSPITTEALKSLKKLDRIDIGSSFGHPGQTPLFIADRAFYHQDYTEFFSLIRNRIENIAPEGFVFKTNLTKKVLINLGSNNLNSISFSNGWLKRVNRPARFWFGRNRITYLDHQFKSYLDNHPLNDMNIAENPLNCSDCRNAWLAKGQDKYKKRVSAAYCDGKGKTTIFDSPFHHCKD